jgi:hypothetical protein
MKIRNDLNLNGEAFLLVSLFHEANCLEGLNRSAAAYVKRYKKQIHATGKVLQWLGLATADNQSPLGYKPSDNLMYLLVARQRGRVQSKKRFSNAEDGDVFDSILDTVLGELDEDSNVPAFVVRVFRQLGLAKDAGLDYVPTARLRTLAAQRRQEARNRREEAKLQLIK